MIAYEFHCWRCLQSHTKCTNTAKICLLPFSCLLKALELCLRSLRTYKRIRLCCRWWKSSNETVFQTETDDTSSCLFRFYMFLSGREACGLVQQKNSVYATADDKVFLSNALFFLWMRLFPPFIPKIVSSSWSCRSLTAATAFNSNGCISFLWFSKKAAR